MNSLLERLPDEQRRLVRPVSGPARAGTPMLAVLSSRRTFEDDGESGVSGSANRGGKGQGGAWLFERKLDGVRALTARDADGVRLSSRTGRSLNATYPELVEALADQRCPDFVADGEIVALNRGRTDFALLQQRLGLTKPDDVRNSGVVIRYYLFDLLRLDGFDVTALPQRTRKALLRDALEFRGPLRYTPHRNHGGQEQLDQACAHGWEGLIAKRADAAYVRRRSDAWLKLKCAAGQELVIGGFTEPAGTRVGLGALLVGYHQRGQLRYAGKVGTGFDTATLDTLRRRLERLERTSPPFADEVRERAVHWVRPELVAQIGFSEWTRAGRLRHPRFLGLREDKRAEDVVKETPSGGTS